MIDAAQKGSFFYRFVLSPDPKKEDRHHDLDMRDIARQTILALEERFGHPLLWVGAVHADHAPHLHAHLIAIVPHKLDVLDFALLRARTTAAALEQRHFLDLMRTRQRKRPYPWPTVAATRRNAPLVPHRRTWGTPGLKYPSLGTSSYARRQARRRRTHAFWHTPAPGHSPGSPSAPVPAASRSTSTTRVTRSTASATPAVFCSTGNTA